MHNPIADLINLVEYDENLQRQEHILRACKEAKLELERLLRVDAQHSILKLKVGKAVAKKKDADNLGHTSAFARAMNELENAARD